MATRRISGRSTATVPVQIANQTVKQGDNPTDADTLLKLALGHQIDVTIPENAKMADVEATLKLAINGYRRLSEASERLKPVIGRILMVVSDRRLYRPEFKNLTAYVEARVCKEYGLGRTTAFEALRIAKAFPSMTTEEYSRYGATRLLIAAGWTDEKGPGVKEFLDASTRMPVDEFKAQVDGLKEKVAEPPTTFVLSLRLPLVMKEQWNALLEDLDMTPTDVFTELINSYIETHGAEPLPQGTATHASASTH